MDEDFARDSVASLRKMHEGIKRMTEDLERDASDPGALFDLVGRGIGSVAAMAMILADLIEQLSGTHDD